MAANKICPKNYARGHHFIYETPTGPTSIGICKYCGEKKEGKNYWDDSWWAKTTPAIIKEIAKKRKIYDDLEKIYKNSF